MQQLFLSDFLVLFKETFCFCLEMIGSIECVVGDGGVVTIGVTPYVSTGFFGETLFFLNHFLCSTNGADLRPDELGSLGVSVGLLVLVARNRSLMDTGGIVSAKSEFKSGWLFVLLTGFGP